MPTPRKYVATDGFVTWRVRLRAFGKETSETFTSITDAERFCALVEALGADGAVAHRDDVEAETAVPLLCDWLTRHVTDLTGVHSRTRKDYLALARRSWLPALGDLPVTAINRSAVAKMVNDLDAAGRAPKTIANAMGLLSACLQGAVEEGLIDRNPCRGIRLPRTGEHEREDRRFLTHDEFDRLLAATPEHWRPFLLTLAGTGLRFSEATALQTHDVDLTAATLRVVRAWKRLPGSGSEVGPPKTRASRRTVDLPPQVVDALAPLVAGRDRNAWVFTGAEGGPVRHSNFYTRVWRPAIADAELADPQPTPHSLRHSYASWLIALGIQLEVIQDLLGHESILTTRGTYGHLSPALKSRAAAAAGVALSGLSSPQPSDSSTDPASSSLKLTSPRLVTSTE